MIYLLFLVVCSASARPQQDPQRFKAVFPEKWTPLKDYFVNRPQGSGEDAPIPELSAFTISLWLNESTSIVYNEARPSQNYTLLMDYFADRGFGMSFVKFPYVAPDAEFYPWQNSYALAIFDRKSALPKGLEDLVLCRRPDTTFRGVWHHVLASWSNVDGGVQLYEDGVELKCEQALLRTGVITQGDGFDMMWGMRYAGEMAYVNMYDFPTPSEGVQVMMDTRVGDGNVLSWDKTQLTFYGDIDLVPESKI